MDRLPILERVAAWFARVFYRIDSYRDQDGWHATAVPKWRRRGR